MGRARWSFSDVAAWQLGFVEFAHGFNLSLDHTTFYKTEAIETSGFHTFSPLNPKVDAKVWFTG